MSLLYLNDTPLDELVYQIGEVAGFRALSAATFAWVPVPNFAGGRFSRAGVMPQRKMRVLCDVRPTTALSRAATLDAIAHMLQGTMTLRLSDAPDRQCFVTASATDVSFPNGAPLGRGDCVLSFDLDAESSLWYAREWRTVWLSSTPTSVPLGTAPSPYLLRMQGAASPTIVFSWRTPLGNIKQSITFTTSLLSTTRLEFDSRTGLVTFCNSVGFRSLQLDYWTAGDPVILDPRDGIPRAGVSPQAAVSAGTALLLYWPAYHA